MSQIEQIEHEELRSSSRSDQNAQGPGILFGSGTRGFCPDPKTHLFQARYDETDHATTNFHTILPQP